MSKNSATYKKAPQLERDQLLDKWRTWARHEPIEKEEKRLRGIISEAYIRLSRLDDSNPEVNHATEILELALKNQKGT